MCRHNYAAGLLPKEAGPGMGLRTERVKHNPHSSFNLRNPHHGRLSKIETAELEEATRRSRSLARRLTFTALKEVQVDRGTSLSVQLSASILRLPLEGVAHT
jgi:hypothetical protein